MIPKTNFENNDLSFLAKIYGGPCIMKQISFVLGGNVIVLGWISNFFINGKIKNCKNLQRFPF